MADEERKLLLPRESSEYDTYSARNSGMENHTSQTDLVFNSQNSGRKLPQYVAAISATLGAFSAGTMLGWASPAESRMKANEYPFVPTENDIAWISSITTLGGAFICFPIAFLMDKIGRKTSMLLLVIPFLIGWLLITFAQNLAMILVGRFLVGLAGGAFFITAPTYTSEIAQTEIRGTLGTFLQLMTVVGILFSYAVGSYVELLILNILCTLFPIIFGIIFFFMPETPYFLVYSNKIEQARKSLKWLRGSEYDSESELRQIEEKVMEDRNIAGSFFQEFSKRSAKMAFFICMCGMVFQQFSGINAVLFNASTIFSNATDAISPEISIIIMGVIQVIATIVATLAIDKWGRKPLLLLSSIFMAISTTLLGVYFYLDEDGKNQDVIDNISWLPLFSLCLFIVTYSFGFGPIPWLVASELCTPNIKAFVSSTSGTFNWLLAFIITNTFKSMQEGLGNGGAFWLFAAFTVVGGLFVIFILPETKGKSIDEVQSILNGENSNAS